MKFINKIRCSSQTKYYLTIINYQLNALIIIFIHKILFSSTCFEHQVLILRRK